MQRDPTLQPYAVYCRCGGEIIMLDVSVAAFTDILISRTALLSTEGHVTALSITAITQSIPTCTPSRKGSITLECLSSACLHKNWHLIDKYNGSHWNWYSAAVIIQTYNLLWIWVVVSCFHKFTLIQRLIFSVITAIFLQKKHNVREFSRIQTACLLLATTITTNLKLGMHRYRYQYRYRCRYFVKILVLVFELPIPSTDTTH